MSSVTFQGNNPCNVITPSTTDTVLHLTPMQTQQAINVSYRQAAAVYIQKSTPINTIRTNAHTHNKWTEWCKEQNFEDGNLVSEDKLRQYLIDCLFGSPSKQGTPYKTSTIMAHVHGITNLWSVQVSAGKNTNSAPRSKAIDALIKAHHRDKGKDAVTRHEDRQAGTLKDRIVIP